MTPLTCARLPGRSAVLIVSIAALAAAAFALDASPAYAAGSPSAADQTEWARDALARNGMFEVVSADPATGIITVRVKSTGELHRVRADEVIATPPDLGPSRVAAGLRSTAGAPSGGRVISSGPGYSISAGSPAASAPGGGAEAENASDAGGAQNVPVEHRHEPIVCQGAQLRQIDGRNLVFDGNAVSVEKGCELHITNSSITAHGIGITARGASVHIDNSIIQGSGAAVDASDGAQVYARSSVFKGLIRRNDTAAFHDLGGNVGN